MYTICEDIVFHEILDSVQTRFRQNSVCTESRFGSVDTLFWECTDHLPTFYDLKHGLYRLCTTLS
eukprot:UN25803